jgi:hypothetical protein
MDTPLIPEAIRISLHTVNGPVTTTYESYQIKLALDDITQYLKDGKSFTVEQS